MQKNLILRGQELKEAVDLENKKILLGKYKNAERGLTLLEKNIKEKNQNQSQSMIEIMKMKEEEIKEKLKSNQKATMLEKSFTEGDEFVKLYQKKNKHLPTDVRTIEEMEKVKSILSHDEKHDKILHYVEKYRIPYQLNGTRKSFKHLLGDVHKYEQKNKSRIIKSGLDKKYKEFGHFITTI